MRLHTWKGETACSRLRPRLDGPNHVLFNPLLGYLSWYFLSSLNRQGDPLVTYTFLDSLHLINGIIIIKWKSLSCVQFFVIPWGRYESDTTEQFHFPFSLSCVGEGNGNPLQCSCLENPRAGGAWWAAVYGVAQSQTRLKRLSSSSRINTIHGILKARILEWVAFPFSRRSSQPRNQTGVSYIEGGFFPSRAIREAPKWKC